MFKTHVLKVLKKEDGHIHVGLFSHLWVSHVWFNPQKARLQDNDC